MDDFYVVLPSNACPDTHPDNAANKFYVTWENPLILAGKWQVALTEATFNYTQSSVNTDYGIDYHEMGNIIHNFHRVIYLSKDRSLSEIKGAELDPLPPSRYPTFDEWIEPTLVVTKTFEGKLRMVIFSNLQFSISFAMKEQAESMNFPTQVVDAVNKDGKYIIETFPDFYNSLDWEKWGKYDWLQSMPIQFTYKSRPFANAHSIRFSRDEYWKDPVAMADSIKKLYKQIFSKFEMKDKKVCFQLKSNIVDITFVKGLNFVFGYDKTNFTNHLDDQPTYYAEHSPQLARGINNMYIYSSVCEPIHVGSEKVPLLKSIWIDVAKRDYKFGEVCDVVIKNPMYVPVAARSINSIETNIRTDSGRLVPFISGSVTSLTLHFKKYG